MTAPVPPELLAPYPDELIEGPGITPVTVEELGWRVLPADATPAQKARAESVWRPVSTDRPCRCSGPCSHGNACDCGDTLMHSDRCAVGLFGTTIWHDEYVCTGCGEEFVREHNIPGLSWGRVSTDENGVTQIRPYPGVRHLQFEDY